MEVAVELDRLKDYAGKSRFSSRGRRVGRDPEPHLPNRGHIDGKVSALRVHEKSGYHFTPMKAMISLHAEPKVQIFHISKRLTRSCAG